MMEPLQSVIDRVVQREREIGRDVLEHERQVRARDHAITRGDQASADFYNEFIAKYTGGAISPK